MVGQKSGTLKVPRMALATHAMVTRGARPTYLSYVAWWHWCSYHDSTFQTPGQNLIPTIWYWCHIGNMFVLPAGCWPLGVGALVIVCVNRAKSPASSSKVTKYVASQKPKNCFVACDTWSVGVCHLFCELMSVPALSVIALAKWILPKQIF